MSDAAVVTQRPVVEQTEIKLTPTVTVFVENITPQFVEPDPDESEWTDINESSSDWVKLREQARFLARKHPNIKRALLLYDMYVLSTALTVFMKPDEPDDPELSDTEKKRRESVKYNSQKVWRKTLEHNHKSWSVSEWGKRVWRDGEQFTRQLTDTYPVELGFIDPEDIDDGRGDATDGTRGIITDPDRVTVPVEYQRYDRSESKIVEQIPADEIHHTKIDVDSNEKRGRSRFESIISTAVMLMAMVRNEVGHRNAQSSIVLIKKVNGNRAAASNIVDNASTGETNYSDTGTIKREKFRAGTILTTTKNVDIEFAQPQSNFSDASPLMKMLLQQISACTGWSYAQLTADPSDGNFASSLVAESPVLQMVLRERQFVADELRPLAKQILTAGIEAGKIDGIESSETLWDDWKIEIEFGDVVSREELKVAQAANIGVMAGALSRDEMARRLKADPAQMRSERDREAEHDIEMMGQADPNVLTQVPNPANKQNPTIQDKKQSSADNANAGGMNQDGGMKPAGHSDKLS